MPEFQRDYYGTVDAFEAQLAHYGIKQGGMPEANDKPQDPTVPSNITERTGRPVRRPVPGSKPSSRNGSPRPSSPVASSRTQSPARKIFRRDGKFDTESIGSEDSQGLVSSRPGSPTPSKKSRTNSIASTGSWKARRASIGRAARRMSDSFKNTFDIVKMDRHERMGYVRTKDDGIKATQQQQQPPSPAMVSPFEDPIRPNAITPSKKENWGSFYEDFDQAVVLPPPSPSTPSKPKPGNLTKGEKFAMSMSKAADPLKLKRKGTNDSDMSFGMTDLAPPGAMQECSSCGRPTEEYLINGLCKKCHALHAKVAKAKKEDESSMFIDPFQFPQGRSTWPDVQSAEHGYMKLPVKKKILRVRDTIYDDPGNPFANEMDDHRVSPLSSVRDEKPLPPIPAMKNKLNPDPFDINPFDDPAFSRRSGNTHRHHRRSKSVALPPPDSSEDYGKYVAPRDYWRKASVPSIQLTRPSDASGQDWRDTKFQDFYEELMQDYSGKQK